MDKPKIKMYLELFASLMRLLPPGTSRHRREIKVVEGTSVQDVIDEYHIPLELAHIVLVNGVFVCEDRSSHILEAGDVLSIWPPVAGG
ncbi:MoaD/ThiS family protein [uncultured Cocleimonas sp.]|uniref:MoaD/ThiS family protein n=1 Tax=uncultured Cocleimonas sp. TaxID=1051587 RepID=UPI0026163A8D|nr:MoaD/ThiS family protein [uncultured Cocleimonas sp.]